MPSIINASSSGSGGLIQTADASGILQLQNNGTVAVTVSNGFVGIGTASPGALLHVQSPTNRAYIQVQSTATTTGPEAGMQFICANRNFYLFNNYDTQTLDTYDATGVAFVLRQGRAGFTTALQGGTPVAGTGITFPASQSASSDPNTLDDYEEGTYTPTLRQTSGGTILTTSQYGLLSSNGSGEDSVLSYVKIGRVVYIAGAIRFRAPGGGISGRFNLSLPFTLSGSTYGLCGSVGLYNFDQTLNQGTFLAANSSSVDFFDLGAGNGTHVNLTSKNGSEIYFNLYYLTAT